MLTRVLIGLVRVYQRVGSPLIGQGCRFHPTCSQYAIDALTRYGPLVGALKTAGRLLRCHPWGGHGHDPA